MLEVVLAQVGTGWDGTGPGGDQAKAARGFGKGGEVLCDPAMCQRILEGRRGKAQEKAYEVCFSVDRRSGDQHGKGNW